MKLRARILLASCLWLAGCGVIDHMTGEDRAREIRRLGLPARARVLQMWDTGMTVNESPVVGLRLEVHDGGHDPFLAETKALIGRLDLYLVHPGLEVPVKYDPNNHTRVALDIYDGRR